MYWLLRTVTSKPYGRASLADRVDNDDSMDRSGPHGVRGPARGLGARAAFSTVRTNVQLTVLNRLRL